jgi:hypothetical protein
MFAASAISVTNIYYCQPLLSEIAIRWPFPNSTSHFARRRSTQARPGNIHETTRPVRRSGICEQALKRADWRQLELPIVGKSS